MPPGHGKKPSPSVHLHVALFTTVWWQSALNPDVEPCAARRRLGEAGDGVNVGLRPGGNRAGVRIAAMVEIDAGIGVVVRKNVAQASATVGARVVVGPLFERDRQGVNALLESTPGGRICRVRIAEGLLVDGNFVELHFPGLLVDAVCTAPQHPLGSGLQLGGDAVEVLSSGAGVESATLRGLSCIWGFLPKATERYISDLAGHDLPYWELG